MQWMDLLRGVAVVLIVFFHAGQVFGSPDLVAAFNSAAGPYRLAALFFASGVLLDRSLAKGLRRYVDGKVRRIVWPYLLWTALMSLLLSGQRWRDPGWWLSPTGSHTWFLATLAGLFVVGLVTRVGAPPAPVAAVLLVASQLIDIEAVPYLHDLTWWGFFFFAGAAAGRRLGALGAAPWWIFALGVAVMVGWGVAVNVMSLPKEKTILVAAVSLVGVATILRGMALAPSAWPFTWLAALGRRSVVTYLAHYPLLLLGARYVPWPESGAGYLMLSGSVLAACFALSAHYPRVRLLFEWPWRVIR